MFVAHYSMFIGGKKKKAFISLGAPLSIALSYCLIVGFETVRNNLHGLHSYNL